MQLVVSVPQCDDRVRTGETYLAFPVEFSFEVLYIMAEYSSHDAPGSEVKQPYMLDLSHSLFPD